MNELYRIMKVGGRIEISLSHFSFYGAYGFKERAFALNSFKIFCDKDNQIYIPNCIVKDRPMFKVISKELSYQRTHNGKLLVKKNFYYYFGRVISYLANLNTHFCERVWCYWVGGFQEMKIVLEKL